MVRITFQVVSASFSDGRVGVKHWMLDLLYELVCLTHRDPCVEICIHFIATQIREKVSKTVHV